MSDQSWFAVRCVFAAYRVPGQEQVYEERITLWRANSADHAIQRAEVEAVEYANAIEDAPDLFLGIAQSFALDAEPGDGVEIFSLNRTSTLSAEEYLDVCFDTGGEFQSHTDV